jgi:catechol-2,3-dioxygenase
MEIHTLQLQAADPGALVSHYGDVLGLPVLASGEHELVVQVGTSRLSFTKAPDGQQPRYHFACNIPQQFAEAKAWLSARVPLIRDNTGVDSFFSESWNAHNCYWRDPAGNILELISRYALPDSGDGPFGSHSLRCISEIGVTTDDVRVAVAEFSQLGLPLYQNDLSDTFAAVGDEHGLLIVVRQGREWYPQTGVTAEQIPLDVTISVAAGSPRIRVAGPPYAIRN